MLTTSKKRFYRALMPILLIILGLNLNITVTLARGNLDFYTSGFYQYQLDSLGQATVTGYKGSEKNLVLPDQLDDHMLIGIEEMAFMEDPNLEYVILPRAIKSIGAKAFYGCKSLEYVVLPENLSYIAVDAFEGCHLFVPIADTGSYAAKWTKDIGIDYYIPLKYQLIEIDGFMHHIDKDYQVIIRGYKGHEKDLVIPEELNGYSVTAIGALAFDSHSYLSSITLPQGLKSIEWLAFVECINLKTVHLPKGLKSIDDEAFAGCIALKDINLPNGLETLGVGVFYALENLEPLILPNSLYSMRGNPFLSSTARVEVPENHPYFMSIDEALFERSCQGLVHYPTYKKELSYTLPAGTKAIKGGAFYSCDGLKEIHLPNSLEWIGIGAFEGCSMLAYIDIPEEVKTIGRAAFWDCTSLKELIIPEGIKVIASWTFHGCEGLEHIELPSGLKRIDNNSFAGCQSLKNLEIPKDVSYIGDEAFKGCSNLALLVYEGSFAEDWAKEKGIDYELMGEVSP